MKIFLAEADTTCSYFKSEYWSNQPSSDTMRILALRKSFEPGSNIPGLKKIIWVIGVLRRTVFVTDVSTFLLTRSTFLLTLKMACTQVSKRQSRTTVLLRTPITQMIFFNQGNSYLRHVQFLFYLKKVIKKEFLLFLKKVGLDSQNKVLKFKLHPCCMAPATKIFFR